MNLLHQLIIGGGMIAVTVVVHAITIDSIMNRIVTFYKNLRETFGHLAKPAISGAIVVILFAAHVVNIWLWASLYLYLDAAPIRSLSDALYFSTITYTTLGYGDIILGTDFRMLSGIEACNGMLLFGWTAAFIFEVISKIYKHEADFL